MNPSQKPPMSMQLSNQQSNGLDIASDSGGIMAANDQPTSGGNFLINDLEEGEIESDDDMPVKKYKNSNSVNNAANSIDLFKKPESLPTLKSNGKGTKRQHSDVIICNGNEEKSSKILKKCEDFVLDHEKGNVKSTKTAEAGDLEEDITPRTNGDILPGTENESVDKETDAEFQEDNGQPDLHELQIIDDLGNNEGYLDPGDDCFDGDEGEEDMDGSDEDLDDNEIYAWLDEGLDKKDQATVVDASGEPIQREKIVLKGTYMSYVSVFSQVNI